MSDIFSEPFGRPAPAAVKMGWTMPSGVCPECGEDLDPVAVVDAEDVGLYLECPDHCCDSVEVEWPLERDFATVGDFEALGFWVIIV